MTTTKLFYAGLCVKVARAAEERLADDARADHGRSAHAAERIGEAWVVAVIKVLEACA